MRNILTFLLVALCSIPPGTKCKVPSYFKVCHRSDPQVGSCITKAVYDLLPRLRVGILEYDIPKIEPLHVRNVSFTTGTDAARVNANLSDVTVYGASAFKILNVTVFPNKHLFHFKVNIPLLYGHTFCEVDAKILFLIIKGKGPMHVNVTDFLFDCKLKGHLEGKNGEDFLSFEKMKCQVEYGKAHIKFDQLFDNPTIGKSTNEVVNDNIDVFIEALKPDMMDAVASMFTNIGNKISSRFNYNEVFPK